VARATGSVGEERTCPWSATRKVFSSGWLPSWPSYFREHSRLVIRECSPYL
jgi:hypothetical protein